MTPVARALAARGASPSLVLTGQQAIDPGDYGLPPLRQWRLDCPGQADPHRHVRSVTAKLLPLLRNPPDLLVVQGDTSSALGAALAGFAANVPVAHVEAGLRTGDVQAPWPEEEYRLAIDADSALLFAPTELAARNLAEERVTGEVHVTGNTGIDSLLSAEACLPPRSLRESGPPHLLVTCHRRESWGEGLASIAAALVELARGGEVAIDVMLHPNAHVAERMRNLLSGVEGVSLIPPCTHRELVERMRDCDLILSDSGGIQEEAPALGTPLLVLREKTERPEAIAAGNAWLVGIDARRIVTETRQLLSDPLALAAMSRRSFPFGDGRAAPRIAAIIEQWLERRPAEQRRLA